MSIKLLALDMDGTLLNRSRQITDRVRKALSEAIKLGVTVVPATGRSHITAFKPLDMFGHDFPVLSSNGAYIRDEKKVYFEAHISPDTIARAVELTKQECVPLYIYTGDMIYATPRNLHTGMIDRWREVCENPFTLVQTDEELLRIPQEKNIFKLFTIDENPERFSVVKSRFRAEFPELSSVNSEEANLDITPLGVNKGSALVTLADMLGIKMSEVMAVGDGENDMEMIELAGIGVAMGNAYEGAKSVSDFITEDNDHDGVAVAVEKFILKEENEHA